MTIHQTSIIDSNAILGKNVTIGPFCVVGPEVILEDNVELHSHVVVQGKTRIGSETVMYPFASIGQVPQILKYKGEKSEVIIGKKNIIREYVTIQAGSEDGGMITSIGDNCLFMVGSHVGHDCNVGSNVVMANYASLAGHVEIGDFVIIGGLAAVHQFVRIGSYAMIGGLSAVVRDLIPFGMAVSERAHLDGINLVGMKRRGFDKHEILDVKKAVDMLFAEEGVLQERIQRVKETFAKNQAAQQIVEFMTKDSSRDFCGPHKKGR